MTKFSLSTCYFLVCMMSAYCQTELKLADDLSALFSGSEHSIKKASLQSESEKTANIQIETVGFKDKSYKISAKVLNRSRQIIKEIPVVELPLDSGSGVTDIFFKFKQINERQYNQAFLESEFIQISIVDKSGATADTGLEFLGLDARNFLYKFKKKWPIKGGLGQEIVVKLVPYKSAATISLTK